MEKIPFLNTALSVCTMEGALDEIERFLREKRRAYVLPVNTDVIMQIEKDEELKKIADGADLVLADGKPLIWIARKQKLPIKEKISGSDLVPLLMRRAAKEGYSVFLLGGKEGVAAAARKNLQRELPALRIVGEYAPPFGFEQNKEELEKIDRTILEAAPDLLLVCLGCPKQEKYVYHHLMRCGATVAVCAGATIDFLAGNIKRAPKWMSNCGLEWLYRFFKEPKRLFKRYFVDDIKIFRLAKKYAPQKYARKEESPA